MRHLLFLTSRFLPSPGGAETYASDLTQHLLARGWRSLVFTDTAGSGAASVFELLPPLDQLADPRRVRWRSLQFGMLDRLEEALAALPAIEIVHANSIEAAVLGRIVADHLKVPLVATIHEHAPEKQSFGLGRCRLVFQRLGLDAVIAPSQFYYERAIACGLPAERTHRVLHGVSASRVLACPIVGLREKWGVPASSWVATLVGRVYAPKGVLEFIEAARLLREDPRFRAIIVGPDGPGEYAREVRERIRAHGLTDVVKLVGEVPQSTIPSVIKSSDVLVAPSLAEGFGLTVVEAMLLEIPVIASRVGGLAEVVRHDETGLLVKPGDVRALAGAMQVLRRSPPTAKRLAAEGAASAATRFSATRMADETARVYEHVLGAHGLANGIALPDALGEL